jgi:hypothetical protein
LQEELEAMIGEKQANRKLPANIAAEKLVLKMKIEELQGGEDDEKWEKIAELEEKMINLEAIAEEKRTTRINNLKGFAEVNERNRKSNFSLGRQEGKEKGIIGLYYIH